MGYIVFRLRNGYQNYTSRLFGLVNSPPLSTDIGLDQWEQYPALRFNSAAWSTFASSGIRLEDWNIAFFQFSPRSGARAYVNVNGGGGSLPVNPTSYPTTFQNLVLARNPTFGTNYGSFDIAEFALWEGEITHIRTQFLMRQLSKDYNNL